MNDLLKVTLIGILGGALPVFIKIGLNILPPQTFILFRYLAALIVLLPIYLYKKEKIVNKKQFLVVAIFGYLNILLAAIGISKTSPIISQMLYSTVPIMTSILAYFFLKQKLNLKKIIGIVLGFAGATIIIVLPRINKNDISTGSLIGNLIVLAAVISYSIYTITSKKVQKKNSSLSIITNLALFTFIMQLVLAPFEIRNIDLISKFSGELLFAIFFTGVIGTAAYHFLYLKAIKSSGPIIASLVLYIQPIFTIVWAIILLGETLSSFLIIGSVFVFSGAYLTSSKNT